MGLASILRCENERLSMSLTHDRDDAEILEYSST